MEVAIKDGARINSSTYYTASKTAYGIHRLLATARVLDASAKEPDTLSMALGYARELKGSDKPLLRQALEFIGPKLISSSAAAGNKMGVDQILDLAIVELEHVIAAKRTDPKTNIYSAILFKELFEFYVKKRLELEARLRSLSLARTGSGTGRPQ